MSYLEKLTSSQKTALIEYVREGVFTALALSDYIHDLNDCISDAGLPLPANVHDSIVAFAAECEDTDFLTDGEVLLFLENVLSGKPWDEEDTDIYDGLEID